jgi:adenosylhomocysteine nucleosidase
VLKLILGIIGAMDEEIENILSFIKIEREEIKAGMKFYFGEHEGNHLVVVRSGIGKVNAAICTQILIDDFNVDKIINVGIAGGTNESIMPGDVVIAEGLVQHDMDTTYFGDEIGQIPRLDVFEIKCDRQLVSKAKEVCNIKNSHNSFVGRVVSGDQFVHESSKLKWLSEKFGALACEMEGASIAQVCYLNKVPFVVIRSISDNAILGIHMDYEKFKMEAIENSTNIIIGMLSYL